MKTETYVYGVQKVNGHDAWALFEACAAGDLKGAKNLLAKDPRLVNAQYWYQFPIHRAVREGHAELVKLLLDKGADPGQSRFTYNSWDKLLETSREHGHRRVESFLRRAMAKRFRYTPQFEALQEAIIARSARRIKAVLREQPQLVRGSDALGNSALHWSVMTRQPGLIRQFVELGTPIDAERADGNTPLLLAVQGSDYWYRATRGSAHPSLRNAWVLVGALLALGARYTISVAAAVGDQERIEELLRKDATLAGRLDSARWSPLSYAARSGHLHIVRLLLDRGADPNLPEDCAPDGRALYEACCRNHFAIAELLLERGANPNAGVDSCECCLTIGAIYHGEQAQPLEELLRRHGAFFPPYRMDREQLKQALRDGHAAVRHDEFSSCVLRECDAELLDRYLDSNPDVVKHLSPGDGAIHPASPALFGRLLERGLDPNARDWLGRTFLHDCADSGDTANAALLLQAGADINARDVESKGTPLAAAVRSCAVAEQAERGRQMVEFLLHHGAAIDVPADDPASAPLALARLLKLPDIVQVLEAKAD